MMYIVKARDGRDPLGIEDLEEALEIVHRINVDHREFGYAWVEYVGGVRI